MGLLSGPARRMRREYFLDRIPNGSAVLEVGSGGQWVREYLLKKRIGSYTGIDLVPPADIVGDIRRWRQLGLKPASYDVVIAFEVIEHVDCLDDCYELLKSGGWLMVTTPLPHMDWLMRLMEWAGLNQRRTSPHEHLIYLNEVGRFRTRQLKNVGWVWQWGIFEK